MTTHVMGIEVNKVEGGKVRIKFVAFVGETGPEFVMPMTMAQELLTQLNEEIGDDR